MMYFLAHIFDVKSCSVFDRQHIRLERVKYWCFHIPYDWFPLDSSICQRICAAGPISHHDYECTIQDSTIRKYASVSMASLESVFLCIFSLRPATSSYCLHSPRHMYFRRRQMYYLFLIFCFRFEMNSSFDHMMAKIKQEPEGHSVLQIKDEPWSPGGHRRGRSAFRSR